MGSDGTTGRRTDGARPRRQDDGDDWGRVRTNRTLAHRRRSEWCDVLACHVALAVDPSSGGRPARDVAFDPNGKWIAAASRRGGVEVWPSTVNGFPRRRLGLVAGVHASTLALSPDGQFLATGTRSGSVLILPVAGAGFRELRGFQGLVYSVAFDATGRRIAASGHVDGRRNEVIRVFDLETGDVKSFDPGDGKDLVTIAFLPDGNLLTSSFGGLRRIDWTTGSSELLLQQPGAAFLAPDGRHVLLLRSENPNFPVGTASVYDLQERRSWPLATHGDQVTLMAWDPSGTRVVTGSREGIVRVGPVTGEEPHLLIGHQGPIWGVRVDPTGRLVASTSEDGTVRIWPMPEGRPLHTLPRDAFLEKLRSLTNVRIVPDASASSGYRDDVLAISRVGPQAADLVTERRDVGNLLLAFRLPPPESIGTNGGAEATESRS